MNTAAAEAKAPSEADGCPAEMVRIRNFCVDRYEATLVERCEDGGETAHPAHLAVESGVRYEARSKAGVLPQGYISQLQSEQACRNASKRLCSAREWYTACRGSKRQTYPYGNAYVRHKCNSGKLHLLGRLFGNNPQRWTYENFNNPVLNREPGFLSVTGEHPECTNEFGAYDMVGNLHEWVSDRVSTALANDVELVGGVKRALLRNGGHGVFMGGFFSTTGEQGPGCDFTTVGHEPRYHDYSTGFRCCRDALP